MCITKKCIHHNMNKVQKTLLLIKDAEEKDRVKSILEKTNPYSLHSDITSLLHAAVQEDLQVLLRLLINCGCEVDTQDLRGRTPLMQAIKGKQIDHMKILLEAGADLFMKNNENQSALHIFFAVFSLEPDFHRMFLCKLRKECSSTEEMAQIMIDAGCHLYQAAFTKNTKILKYMLKQGLPIDSMHPSYKTTAFHIANMLEDVRSIKVLAKYGADVKALDFEGLNSLYYLYRHNTNHTAAKIIILKFLLHLGISPTTLTPEGTFQSMPTLATGNLKAIRLLLRSGIDFKARDSKKKNLLHYLVRNLDSKVPCELKLHIHKFDINEVDEDGMTPLHEAVRYSCAKMVKFLLDHGAEVNCPEYRLQRTPLYLSCFESSPGFEKDDDRCFTFLLEQYADPQFLAVKNTGEPFTIFDVALANNAIKRMKYAVAHLALLEGLGTPITDLIYSKINSHHELRKYFKSCRSILAIDIVDSVTVFKLLTADKRKIIQYLGNKQLIRRLKRISYKQKVKFSFQYYWNTLSRRISKGMSYKKLKCTAAVVISKIFKNCVDERHLITDKTIEYLDDKDLRHLYQLQKMIGSKLV